MAYTFSYQLQQLYQDTLLKDDDHLISPEALNKFRHLMVDVEEFDSLHLDHLASSLIDSIIYKDIKPIILGRKREPQESYIPSKIELPDDQKLRLQHDIIDFAKAAVADANRQNRRAIQIRVIFKVRKEQRKSIRYDEEDTELDCAICTEPLKKEDDDNNNIRCTPCRHFFHEHCYLKWRRRSRSCPMCRSTLTVT